MNLFQRITEILCSRRVSSSAGMEGFLKRALTSGWVSWRTPGGEHANACQMLAFAYAGLNRWEEAVQAIDNAKSLRYRYQMALRATPEAARVIELEAALHDRERGIGYTAGSITAEAAIGAIAS